MTQNRVPTRIDWEEVGNQMPIMALGMETETGDQILGWRQGTESPTLGMETGTVDRIPDSVLGTGTDQTTIVDYGSLLAAHAETGLVPPSSYLDKKENDASPCANLKP
eukprot:CAMPEP_0194398010 /NCGR_PEP_ID=MMETSP0174-20130528/125867_1 /TAXON_ID=216777 /ORGANISM="Proboscia alata, Strain PI-D3" /LENGTH=107 /DNA_ID=CAMNT_0039194259 /DNA_START=363 /DNA_END=687 /DNA_ORIENTATION=+